MELCTMECMRELVYLYDFARELVYLYDFARELVYLYDFARELVYLYLQVYIRVPRYARA